LDFPSLCKRHNEGGSADKRGKICGYTLEQKVDKKYGDKKGDSLGESRSNRGIKNADLKDNQGGAYLEIVKEKAELMPRAVQTTGRVSRRQWGPLRREVLTTNQ